MSETENAFKRWVPAEPLDEPFGVMWERAIMYRKSLGQPTARCFVGGWLDAFNVRQLAKTS